ncbi:MAG: M36 family metallopeptidase, partial [Marinicellaceae bacterium]
MKNKILIMGFSLIVTVCFAKKEPIRIVDQILPEKENTIIVSNKFINSKTGLPTTLANIGFKAKSSTPEAIAREYLLANQTTFSLKYNHINDLKLTNIRKGKATTTVRFKQYHQGIEVYNSDVVVSYNKSNTITYVSNQLKPVENFKQPKSLLENSKAESIALNYLGNNFKGESISSKNVIFFNKGSYLSAYKVEISSGAMQGDWLFIIDAKSGQIYLAIDTVAYQNASATVFDPDPLSTSGSVYAGNFRDNNDTNNSDLEGELFTKDIDLRISNGTYFLTSPYAQSVDISAPNDGIFSQTSSAFNYNRQDAAFESTNTFYHLDNYLRYLNDTLGLSVRPYQYSGGVRYDAHALNGDDISNYTSSSGTLRFGEGCVDDAEDADVVIHELGHGIHDWVTNGGLSQVEGLSEGLGDYFAQSYSRSRGNQVWTPSQPAYHYMFSWDGHNQCWPGRTTNYSLNYPQGLSSSIHTSGQIWSTCLMKIWDQIGVDKTDTIVIEGIAMTGSNTSQPQAAQAVLQAAADLGMVQDLSTIQSTFNSCGYNVSIEIPSLVPTISMSGQSNINNSQVFSVAVEGGTGPYRYAWDVNNDGEVDGTNSTISVNYSKAFGETVTVNVTDSENISANALMSVNITAPDIVVQNTGTMTQMCGNDDAFVDPGERWSIPVTVQNNGFVSANNAHAVFVKGTSASNQNSLISDSFGNSIGSCSRQFIDISTTGTEVNLVDSNSGDIYPAQDEGAGVVNLSQAFDFYGQTINSLALSSNGYISINTSESGADFDNDCPLPSTPNNGTSTSARIIPLHDDLISEKIYHQHFSSCPRPSDLGANLACDVFMYD